MEVLLAGNTGYLTEEFLEQTFPQSHILICGDVEFEHKRKNIPVLKLRETRVAEVSLERYDLDRIVYFSESLTLQGEKGGELETLCRIFEYCRGRQIQCLYITGKARNKNASILTETTENICRRYQEDTDISLKILRAPYLYSAKYKKDWMYRAFQQLENGKVPELPVCDEDPAAFLYLDDLGELIFRIFDNWDQDNRILEIPDVFHIRGKELKNAFSKLAPGLWTDSKREYSEQSTENRNVNDKNQDQIGTLIREKYGWFPKISILEDLNDQYALFMGQAKPPDSPWKQIWKQITGREQAIKWVEIALFFAFSEILHEILGNSAQFRYIDVRLLYVVIVGTVYGLTEGVTAAFLAVCALTVSYIREGANGLTLFYEPSNWLPYILYFVVGAVCGYVQMKNRKDIAFANEENALLKDKFLFIRALYQDTTAEKAELKRQLLGRKDSFGKIFDITKKLDSERPQEIFIQAVKVLEEVLENHSIQIYSFGKNPYFARLEAASKDISAATPRSLRVEEYQAAIEAIENDGIWVNRDLKQEYPMYMTGIRKDERLVLLICIRHASYEQMTLYYQNLVKILCGLVETSLLRAFNYQAALYEEQHVGGTIFLKEAYFLDKLKLYHNMSEEQIAEYTLLKLDQKKMTLEEASDVLTGKIRESDTAGVNAEGEIYLILHQTSAKNAGIVIARLKESGFSCQVISRAEEGMK